jgi:hypothetical protein
MRSRSPVRQTKQDNRGGCRSAESKQGAEIGILGYHDSVLDPSQFQYLRIPRFHHAPCGHVIRVMTFFNETSGNVA